MRACWSASVLVLCAATRREQRAANGASSNTCAAGPATLWLPARRGRAPGGRAFARLFLAGRGIGRFGQSETARPRAPAPCAVLPHMRDGCLRGASSVASRQSSPASAHVCVCVRVCVCVCVCGAQGRTHDGAGSGCLIACVPCRLGGPWVALCPLPHPVDAKS